MIKNECEVKAGFDPAALFQVREAKMTSKTSLVETARTLFRLSTLEFEGARELKALANKLTHYLRHS